MILSFLNRPILIVTLITLLAAGLRVFNLGEKSIWLDEAKVLWTSQAAITESYRDFSGPPLYPFLVYLASLVDTSEILLRGFSAIAGILSVPSIYVLARRWMRRSSAYVCALIAAVSMNQVFYSQQVREYSLTFLLTIWILLTFQRFLNQPHWKNTALLAAACVLGIVNQYGIAMLIVSLNLLLGAVIVGERLSGAAVRRALVSRWVVVQAVFALTTLALYEVLLKQQMRAGGLAGGSYLAEAYWDGSLPSLLWLVFFQTYQILDFAFVYSSLFLLLCGLGVFCLWRRNDRTALWLLLLPLLVTFIAALFRLYPYHGNRHVIFLTPMLYVAAALGFETLTRLKWSADTLRPVFVVLLLGALFMPAMFHTGLYLQSEGGENVRPLVDTLRREFDADAGDRLYVGCAVDEALRYYYPDFESQWILQNREREANLAVIDSIALEPGRLWLIYSHCSDYEPRSSIERLSTYRVVTLVDETNDAWLYRAD